MKTHEQHMLTALEYAQKAYAIGEVPIGAIVVDSKDNIIGYGYNDREKTQDATRHAEIIAIRMATSQLKSWRLEDCTLYVTLEPCPMCCGAIIQSRIKKVVFGAQDGKGGCAGSICNLLDNQKFNHQPIVLSGILAEECGKILSDFFKELRTKRNISQEISEEVNDNEK
jgi:Cytosine/adenosine deaminases